MAPSSYSDWTQFAAQIYLTNHVLRFSTCSRMLHGRMSAATLILPALLWRPFHSGLANLVLRCHSHSLCCHLLNYIFSYCVFLLYTVKWKNRVKKKVYVQSIYLSVFFCSSILPFHLWFIRPSLILSSFHLLIHSFIIPFSRLSIHPTIHNI